MLVVSICFLYGYPHHFIITNDYVGSMGAARWNNMLGCLTYVCFAGRLQAS